GSAHSNRRSRPLTEVIRNVKLLQRCLDIVLQISRNAQCGMRVNRDSHLRRMTSIAQRSDDVAKKVIPVLPSFDLKVELLNHFRRGRPPLFTGRWTAVVGSGRLWPRPGGNEFCNEFFS